MTINLAESLQAFLIGCIDEQEWIDLTVEMVAIGQPNSTNPLDPDIPAGEEEAYALFVAGKLEAMGFKVKKYASQSKRPNIVGVLKGEGGGPSLMINDHLDTYPAVEPERWDKCDGDPFKATRSRRPAMATGSMAAARRTPGPIWQPRCWRSRRC